jgi:hypothetical protein
MYADCFQTGIMLPIRSLYIMLVYVNVTPGLSYSAATH